MEIVPVTVKYLQQPPWWKFWARPVLKLKMHCYGVLHCEPDSIATVDLPPMIVAHPKLVTQIELDRETMLDAIHKTESRNYEESFEEDSDS